MGVIITKHAKYVNRTDVILQGSTTKGADPATVALIELLFFAYRDFVSDPDHLLESLGFGRAHHRVIHFIGRSPGMTVAALLDILGITKQSLSRVLKELIVRRYVLQQEGHSDRRQRLLHLTPEGRALHQQLMAPQIARIERAIAQDTQRGGADMRELLLCLISPDNRAAIDAWMTQAELAEETNRA